MKVRHLFAFLIALLATSPSLSARADDPPPKEENLPQRTAAYTWDPVKDANGKPVQPAQTLLKATFNYRDLIDPNLQGKLANGLSTDIVMRAYLLREGDKTPITLSVRTCNVKYDLWDNLYRLTITTTGLKDRTTAIATTEGVLRQCAEVTDLLIADKALLTGAKPFFLGVIAEVNPVSADMLAQLRQWVARPAGSTGIGPGDALFGSVLGLFVKQIGKADKTLRFRTQSFVVP